METTYFLSVILNHQGKLLFSWGYEISLALAPNKLQFLWPCINSLKSQKSKLVQELLKLLHNNVYVVYYILKMYLGIKDFLHITSQFLI
jgi:hypothetical protein